MPRRLPATLAIAVFAATGAAGQTPVPGDREMVAAIREEGLHRSGLPETLSYLTDVIGARLTNSAAMERAQRWAVAEMERIGLSNVAREPFMDYGASWDNEYFSLHLTEPVYRRMTGYPIAHTPGTDGRLELSVVIADVRSRGDLDGLRGELRGLAVLSTRPPPWTGRASPPGRRRGATRRCGGSPGRCSRGPVPSRCFAAPTTTRPANPELLTPVERLAFYLEEGAAAVLESRSGWPGAVRGFARPGAKVDRWDREATLSSLPIIAVTPEHYNRMYRVRRRGLPVAIELEVRNRHGEGRTEARNVFGEIPGSDLADEVVMIGAHFDTWHASPNASDNSSGTAGDAGGDAHPAGGLRRAAPDDPAGAVVRRGAGHLRISGPMCGSASAIPPTRKRRRRLTTNASRCTSTRTTARAGIAASGCRATNGRVRSSRRGWRRSPTSG